MRTDKWLKTLPTVVMACIAILALTSSCSNRRASPLDSDGDTIRYSEESYFIAEDSVRADYEIAQTDVPDFSGDWESTNSKFPLSLSVRQHSGNVEIVECQIYRVYAWEPSARIEGDKLILDDPDNSFSFHAEFILRDGKLTGQCRAKGGRNDPNFSGNLTLKPENKDNALSKLLGSGGTYRYTEDHVVDYYGEKVKATYGLEIGLQGGPQIATYKYFAQENYEGSGQYEIEGYNITINIDDGRVIIPGHFSTNMSTLYLNFNGQKMTLKRIGDFNYNW